jgi:hypothetical protein
MRSAIFFGIAIVATAESPEAGENGTFLKIVLFLYRNQESLDAGSSAVHKELSPGTGSGIGTGVANAVARNGVSDLVQIIGLFGRFTRAMPPPQTKPRRPPAADDHERCHRA